MTAADPPPKTGDDDMVTMTGLTIATVDNLAVAIQREHKAASDAAVAALDHALEAGRLLVEARAAIPHGGWEAFVRDRCGIATRTARLYLQLDANRDRIADRQRVAGLSVREAARLVAKPKAAESHDAEPAPVAAATAGGMRLRVPEWYLPGHRHVGIHPSEWIFDVWPHPAGDPWVHYYVVSGATGFPGDSHGSLVGAKRGIRVDAVEWSIGMQVANGMPPLDDPEWDVISTPVDAAAIAAEPVYNSWLFNDAEDYRRRGLGLVGSR